MLRIFLLVLALAASWFAVGPVAFAAEPEVTPLADQDKAKDQKPAKPTPPNPPSNPGNSGNNNGNQGNGNGNSGNNNGNSSNTPSQGNSGNAPSPGNSGNSNGNQGNGNSGNTSGQGNAPGSNSNAGGANNSTNKSNPSNTNSSNNTPASTAKTPVTRGYYGQLTLSAPGQAQLGDTRIKSNSPWLGIAAPGMWVEANGYWEGDVFIANEVKLQVAQSWSYYRGPAVLVGAKDYSFVEAWLTTDRSHPFFYLKTGPELPNQVRMVAYFDGKKLRAVPPNFPNPPVNTPIGWVELLGTVSNQTVVWNSIKPFP